MRICLVSSSFYPATFYGGPISATWDLSRKLSEKYTLKDEKIWCQDKQSLSPFGYPFSWTSNIVHHYCLIFQK